ncbi:MAG: 4a-hydroxytetrahydrobiopterin dehydratase [Sphingobium sp.]|nr:4a-hydroxytetrahydrobiopterin dehydratase [Sphingomonas sp.]
MIEKLSSQKIETALAEHADWQYDDTRDAFHRELHLKDFSEAFALMTRIAMEAEKADHHPEWSNVYNRLSIWLTTHDANGVSERDVKMMAAIDAMVSAG